jgi:hypothetical protein
MGLARLTNVEYHLPIAPEEVLARLATAAEEGVPSSRDLRPGNVIFERVSVTYPAEADLRAFLHEVLEERPPPPARTDEQIEQDLRRRYSALSS